MNTISKKRILLVDDHQLVIEGISSLLKDEADFEIMGVANNGKEALTLLKNSSIDIVVTDVKMPIMDGIELTKLIKQDYPDIKILVLTMFAESTIVNEILGAEAEGYLLKNSSKAELLKALRHIAEDGTYYSREVLSAAVKKTKQEESKHLSKTSLSERELEIIQLICNELSSSQIAFELNISQHTVDTHRKNIIKKTGVKTLVGLIKYALGEGLINSDF